MGSQFTTRLISIISLIAVSMIPFQSTGQAAKEAPIPQDVIENSDLVTDDEKINQQIMRETLFEMLKQNKFVLTPEQKRELFELERQDLEATIETTEMEAIKTSIPINLAPDAELPIIYVTPGWNSHLHFIDITGKPWPITHLDDGNKDLFNISRLDIKQPDSEMHESNIIRIESKFRKGATNLSVLLYGKNAMVSLEVNATANKYHTQTAIQIPDYGPNSEPEPVTGIKLVTSDKELKQAIYGGAGLPEHFEELQSSEPSVKAWLNKTNNQMLVRSRHEFVGQILGTHHGGNNFRAYRTPYMPVALFNTSRGNELMVYLTKD